MVKSLSPQARRIFRFLLNGKTHTIHELSQQLNILPNTIYREIEKLNGLNLIEKGTSYPLQVSAKNYPSALQGYLLSQQAWFLQEFTSPGSTNSQSECEITLIKSRPQLFELSNIDMDASQHEVDLIISGFESPTETMLANKRALDRGVLIKNLVQQDGFREKERYLNWKRLGIEIRMCKSIDARILIYDTKIVYLVSYDPYDNKKATGVRIVYQPIAEMMKVLFKQKWDDGILI